MHESFISQNLGGLGIFSYHLHWLWGIWLQEVLGRTDWSTVAEVHANRTANQIGALVSMLPARG